MKKKSVVIVFPVYAGNLGQIEESVAKVSAYCEENIKEYAWEIMLGINGPYAEKVIALAKALEKKNKNLHHKYTMTPGKGAGLKVGWGGSKANILTYMDVDLSVDLSDFKQMIEYINEFDICVGSRYHKDSNVERSFTRKCASWVYHRILQRILLGTKCEDLHCGFKAFKRETIERLMPFVQDTGWYFDSEIMSLAERLGYKIKTIPITWTEGNVSGLHLRRVIPAFILKTLELRLRPLPEVARKNND